MGPAWPVSVIERALIVPTVRKVEPISEEENRSEVTHELRKVLSGGGRQDNKIMYY
jgi:hypothetical protein